MIIASWITIIFALGLLYYSIRIYRRSKQVAKETCEILGRLCKLLDEQKKK